MFNNIILEKAARCVKTYGFRIGILDASLDDSGGILYLNSRGLARVQSPLVGRSRSGNPRFGFVKDEIPKESFLISDENGEYQKRFLRNP